MNKFTLQFYNYIYFAYTDSEILLFNTINNQAFVFSISAELYHLWNGIMIIDAVNDETRYFLNMVSQKKLGQISKYSQENKYYISQDFHTRLFEWKEYLKNQIDNNFIANNFINVLTLFLDSYYEPFTFEHKTSIIMNKMDITFLKTFLEKGYFSKLNKMQMVGTLDSCISIKESLIQLSKRVKIELFIPIQEIDERSFRELKEIEVKLSVISIGYTPKISTILKNRNINIIYIINNEKDILYLKQENLLYDTRITIRFSDNCNLKFRQKYLCYSIKDLLKEHISIDKIIINELCNELSWGKLIINSHGNILSHPRRTIGNINNIEKVEYKDLLSDESLWVMTRKKFPKCICCLYNNLCPPLTLGEILSEHVFCRKTVI